MQILVAFYSAFMCLAVAAYFLKGKYAYVILVIIILGFIGGMKAADASSEDIIYLACILCASTVCVKMGSSLSLYYRKHIEEEIANKSRVLNDMRLENGKLIEKRKTLDERALVIGRIYKILKTMSGTLKVSGIVGEFLSFVNENYKFAQCHLIVFGQDAKNKHVNRIYSIKKEDVDLTETHPDVPDTVENWKTAIAFYMKGEKHKGMPDMESDLVRKFGIDKPAGAFAVIPFNVENKMIAAVGIEGLSKDNKKTFFVLVSQVAMELKRASLYEEVEKLSFTDGLTEIYLRRYFIERFSEEIKRSERINLKFAFLMIDIDNFKKCNDTYGHMVGDVVLREVASKIKENTREIDLVSRYGGEEFTVLLPETDKKAACQVAERIRKAIESKTVIAYDEVLKVEVSIGISLFPEDAGVQDDIINKADKAMYSSKKSGRNRVMLYEDIK